MLFTAGKEMAHGLTLKERCKILNVTTELITASKCTFLATGLK